MKVQSKIKRNNKGAMLGLVAACGGVLTIVIFAFFTLSMFMGGGREIHNGTDAGALNVGKEVFTNRSFKVNRQGSQYEDVADKNGEFGLANINAVWGRALLASANSESMRAEGLAANSKNNADRLFTEAKGISEELARKLNDESNQFEIFEEQANRNSVRMLGLDSVIKADQDAESWQTSLMDRGQVSNIEVTTPEILPSEESYRALQLKNSRIPGYTPIRVGGRVFCFVPFADKERTHLVASSEFVANKVGVKPLAEPEWGEPVPNSFSCKGTCVDQMSLKHTALSCVVANPQRTYKLSMPHSFVHIKLEENRANWLFNAPDPRVDGFNVGLVEKNSGYANRIDPTRKSGGGGSAVDGRLNGNLVPLGKEYSESPSLETALFGSALENGDRSKLKKALVQRINQMIAVPGKKFSQDDLHDLLSNAQTGVSMQAGGAQDYYIYSPDGKEIAVDRVNEAVAKAAWLRPLIANEADGGVANDYIKLSSDLILPPGIVMVDPLPGANVVVPPFGRMNVEITDSWQPGSGYGGCLGKVVVSHRTKVFLWGVAIIPAAPGAGLLERLFDW